MQNKSPLPRIIAGLAMILVITLPIIGIAVTKIFLIDYYRTETKGMYPGLPFGSGFFVVKRPYRNAAEVKRGDVVVFIRNEQGRTVNFVWRVIGLPGDAIRASGESLSINGQSVIRQRLRECDGKTIYREQLDGFSYEVAFDSLRRSLAPDAFVTVPPDHLFVVGDNRFSARDSRSFGPIPFSSIIGKKL